MADPNRKKPRRRTALSADLIASEALALVDDVGLEEFSYRKLAKRMHCEAMSLYHYFPSKSHLFDAMINICVDETPVPPRNLPARERLRGFALTFRETALRHPGFARFWITHRLNHRHALNWLNDAVAVFEDSGLPTPVAAQVFRNFSYWLMGAALDEASGYARGPSAAEPVPADEAARDFPAIARLGRYFGTEHHREIFETGLDMWLDWLDDEVHAARGDRNTA